jgi:hypothetical protein
MTAHIKESYGQQGSILLEASYHTLLALSDEHKTLRANLRDGSNTTSGNVLAGNGLETFVGFGLARLGDDGDNVKDVDAAADGKVLALREGGSHREEETTLLCLLRDFELQCLHTLDGFT